MRNRFLLPGILLAAIAGWAVGYYALMIVLLGRV